jgi:hypothetical protein
MKKLCNFAGYVIRMQFTRRFYYYYHIITKEFVGVLMILLYAYVYLVHDNAFDYSFLFSFPAFFRTQPVTSPPSLNHVKFLLSPLNIQRFL